MKLWPFRKFRSVYVQAVCNPEFDFQGLNDLRASYPVKRAWIIGSGPSLKVSDLNKLKGETTFAANKIFLQFDKTSWRPSFYSVNDDLLWPKIADEVSKRFDRVFLSPNLDGKLTSTKVFQIPRRRESERGPGGYRLSTDIRQGFFLGHSVSLWNLQLAIYFGAEEIFLLGMDNDYGPRETAGGKIIHKGESLHFHPEYRTQGETVWAANPAKIEWAFQEANEAAKALNIKIFNATRGGKLEIFPRVNFDDIEF